MTNINLSAFDRPVSLAGEWEFELDPSGRLDVGTLRPDRVIRVPLPWQASSPELRRYGGYAWYRRTFEVDGALLDGDLRLRFGAVDYWAEVFLNRQRLGAHEGGYTPFEFGLREVLRPGVNELTVRVYDAVTDAVVIPRWPGSQPRAASTTGGPPFDAAEVPHGKQGWYVETGGIWQDVVLIPRADTWIERVRVTPDGDLARALVDVTVAGLVDPPSTALLRLEVLADGLTMGSTDVDIGAGRGTYRASVAMRDARPWSLDDPFLHDVVAEMPVGDRVTRAVERFGMRTFTAEGGRFYLNGRPIYLAGVLDQDFYAEGISSIPSRESLRETFQSAKALGINCLRCHIKIPDPTYLDVADEVGLLVWEELPSWRTFGSKGTLVGAAAGQPEPVRRRVEATLDALIERDHNHPSVVIRTLINEDWGPALAFSAADRRWLLDLVERAKRSDPSRLVVDNSPCAAPWGTNFHVKSDIDDFHLYATIPDQAYAFAAAVDDLALRPLWTYSTVGDSQRRGDEPIVLSEFGNWALPMLGALGGEDREPDWFEVCPWAGGWAQEPGSPSGVATRFDAFGLNALWPGYDAFARATQAHQAAALRFQLETLRRHPTFAGHVITQLTDTFWESNGLMDFLRGPKGDREPIAAAIAQDVLIAIPDRRSYPSGALASLQVSVSLAGRRAPDGSRLVWQVVGDDRPAESVVGGIGLGVTRELGAVAVRLPTVDAPERVSVSLSITGPDGADVVATEVVVVVMPTTAPEDRARLGLGVPGSDETGRAHGLADRLRDLGYPVSIGTADAATVLVTDAASAELLERVHAGDRLLYLVDGRNPFFWVQDVGGSEDGWITSFSWIRPSAHARTGSLGSPLGLEFIEVMPVRTITGVPFDDPAVHEDILAGRVSGWVHHPTAHTLQFRFGRGRVVMTTFRLGPTVGVDPIATAMFSDLVDHLASDRCRPRLAAVTGRFDRATVHDSAARGGSRT